MVARVVELMPLSSESPDAATLLASRRMSSFALASTSWTEYGGANGSENFASSSIESTSLMSQLFATADDEDEESFCASHRSLLSLRSVVDPRCRSASCFLRRFSDMTIPAVDRYY